MEQTRTSGRSLGALAELAARQANAAGYALYELEPEGGRLTLVSSQGARGPAISRLEDLGRATSGTESFGLWSGEALLGALVFAFSEGGPIAETRGTLQRAARIIEVLLGQFRLQEERARVAARVGELETRLADEKIADRVAGIMEGASVNENAIEMMERHVQTVLGARNLDRVLDELLLDLEQRTEERGLLAQAKTLLQQKGLSEYEAHAQLRTVSRRNRQRVGEVARQVIQEMEAQAR